eukprot:5706338-Alexandrium_andersonii.AAC.1
MLDQDWWVDWDGQNGLRRGRTRGEQHRGPVASRRGRECWLGSLDVGEHVPEYMQQVASFQAASDSYVDLGHMYAQWCVATEEAILRKWPQSGSSMHYRGRGRWPKHVRKTLCSNGGKGFFKCPLAVSLAAAVARVTEIHKLVQRGRGQRQVIQASQALAMLASRLR